MKRREVIFSAGAEQDFINILDWLTPVAGGNIALSYVLRIRENCLTYDVGSERGTLRNDVLPNLRISGFEKRVTFAFIVSEEKVEFLRIFYGGRNWEGDFDDREKT